MPRSSGKETNTMNHNDERDFTSELLNEADYKAEQAAEWKAEQRKYSPKCVEVNDQSAREVCICRKARRQ
jgi:hypothetical protein